MKTNVDIKGVLMLCLVMGLFIIYIAYFQHSRFSTIISITVGVLFFTVSWWTVDNSNKEQFKRIMKKVGGDNLLYIVDGSAAVEIDSLVIYYGLDKKEDKFFESNKDVEISVSCALPLSTHPEEVFNTIRNDLAESLKEDIAECAQYKFRYYSFSVHFKLHPKRVSVAVLQQIQQSLVSILINKYHLNTIKMYLQTNEEKGSVYYWEFIGYEAAHYVGYDAENNVIDYDDESDYDNEDGIFNLSDIENATVITKKEFNSVYAAVENIRTED